MKLVQYILCLSALLIPVSGFSHDSHRGKHWNQHYYHDSNYKPRYYYDYYRYDEDDYHWREKRKERHHNKKHYKKKKVRAGWDVSPKVAKRAPNCYRYTLSAKGGKGSARISSIPGKNYIQVKGSRSGYVCFQGDPTLELGKLGNPNIKVTFKLEGRGKYGFYRGQKGSSYRNHWYRSYWDL